MVSLRINGLTRGRRGGRGKKETKTWGVFSIWFLGVFFVVVFFFYLEVPHSIVNQGASGSGKYKFITVTEPPSSAFLLILAPLAEGIINSSWPKFAE